MKASPKQTAVPKWDQIRRELSLDGVVVKRFRQPAKNQEIILATFEDDGWPAHIDNPLAGVNGHKAEDRLHGAIQRLNHQTVRLIRFFRDGHGEGVFWELIPQEP